MNDARYRLLLIRGLEHSGTTILDLALGGNPQIVGLGEASRLLREPRPGDKHNGPRLLRGPDRFPDCVPVARLPEIVLFGATICRGLLIMTLRICL